MRNVEREVNPTAGSLLGFLAGWGPLTGWELNQAVETSIGNFWNVTRSQIYRELRDLAARGFVEAGQPGPRDRVPYHITDQGRRALEEWLSKEPGQDLIRHRLLLTVFFADHLPPGRLEQILEDQRQHHQDRLTAYRLMEEDRVGSNWAMGATLRFGIAYEQMVLAWLASLEPDIENATSTQSAAVRTEPAMPNPQRKSSKNLRPR